MRNRILWLLTSGLMVVSLVLAACGPTATAPTTPTTPTTPVTPSTPTTPTTPTTPSTPTTPVTPATPTTTPPSDTPRYGGTYTEATGSSPIGFDPLVVPTNSCPTLQFTHDTLLGGDWTKGPAGSGQTDWLYGLLGNTSLYAGQLATSWEIPDSQTIIYHIRPGVHWQNKAPVNGRELTAADVAWTLQSEWTTPGTNWDIFFAKPDRTVSVNATDKYTVLVKVPAGTLGINFLENSERGFIRAPEPTAVFGNQNDWRNQNTTGPFYISDFVPGSIITYTKNPNYWETDPVGPGKGNQLPYADRVVQLVIPDTSTRLAAFRVGKIDLMKSQPVDDAADLLKRNPALKSVQVVGSALFLAGRVDKPELPFKDVNVRRALNMAVNKQEIVDLFYKGKADIYGYPFPNTPAYSAFYTPFNDLPDSVKELYTYNPEKAKQLLKDAGYPNGFKVNIVVAAAGTNVDYVAMVKSYLDKVGVNLTIQPMENATYTALTNNKNYDMIARGTTLASLPYMLHEGRIDSQGDFANWQDAKSLAAYQVIKDNLSNNDAAWVKALHDLTPDLLDQAWGIFMPQPYVYHLWWPWVKNFHGEVQTGYARFNRNIRYLWIDKDLKKSMGY